MGRIKIMASALALSALICLVYQQTPTTINVGIGQTYTELHEIPEIKDGDTVLIHYRAQPYKSKIVVSVSNVTIKAVYGPNGESPVLDARNAIEPKWAQGHYFSDQIERQGIITVCSPKVGSKPKNVRIEGLRLTGCRAANAGFTSWEGKGVGWNSAAAGVALYACENVSIIACAIVDNDNGIFGKSYGTPERDLRGITVEWNNFSQNGVSGSDRFHNSYIEGIHTFYRFNHYFHPKSGSAGCNLKDRGCRTQISFNRFEGGARIIDLVDPEDGAPTFTQEPGFGRNDMVGNVIINPASGGSSTAIHVGFDGMAVNKQKQLMVEYNTYVTLRPKEGVTWYTYPFKAADGVEIYCANSIFHGFTTTGKPPSEFRMVAGKAWLGLVNNYLPTWAVIGDSPGVWNWDKQIRGTDPKFVNQVSADYRLQSRSPCVNQSAKKADIPWAFDEPTFGYNPPQWTWNPRASLSDLGAVQLAAQPPPVDPPPPPPSANLEFDELETGINKADVGTWAWGICAYDFDKDGRNDILVTDHEYNGTRVYRNTGVGFAVADVGSKLGSVFRPLILSNGNLLFRDGKTASAYKLENGKYAPINFSYGEGDPSLPLVTPLENGGFQNEASYGTSFPKGRKYEPKGTSYAQVAYTHPMHDKASPAVKAEVTTFFAKPVNRFLRCWWVDGGELTALSGFASYGGDMFGRYLDSNGADVTQAKGLPWAGTPVCAHDFNGDGIKDWIIDGQGLYLSSAGTFTLKAGPVTDFVKVIGAYFKQVTVSDLNNDGIADLIILDPRGKRTGIFQGKGKGEFALTKSVGTWDGEPSYVADMNGDGLPDVVLGVGATVKVFQTKK